MDNFRKWVVQIFDKESGPETWDETLTKKLLGEMLDLDLHRLLITQIPFLWELLDKDEKIFSINQSEIFRHKQRINRDTEEFAAYFARHVITHMKSDLNGEGPQLKKKLIRDWDFTKRHLFCYNPLTEKTLRFTRFIGISEDQNVYLASDPNSQQDWVVKWEMYSDVPNAETTDYLKLKALGAQTPDILEDFKFLGFSVLVIELLQPLDVTDSPIQVGKQLLAQLEKIHIFACYFDLKPDNIKKRPSQPPKYFIIDMNLSKEIRPDGTFKRLHWTPLFSSQIFPRIGSEYQRSSYVNDFIELKYVLHQMLAKRAYHAKYDIFSDTENVLKTPCSEFGLLPDDFLADPETMKTNKIATTARGWNLMKSFLEYPACYSTIPITKHFMYVIENLSHGFPPTNIHALLMAQLDVGLDAEKQFFEETKNVTIQCKICSNVAAAFRCGQCYTETSFLCSDACAIKHKCV